VEAAHHNVPIHLCRLEYGLYEGEESEILLWALHIRVGGEALPQYPNDEIVMAALHAQIQ
jgi:predicted PolB exonuclease-like 3'-5' exonuclease